MSTRIQRTDRTNRRAGRRAFTHETLETRDLLTGDVGGVLGLQADINDNGIVDFADFLILSTTYEQESLPEVNGDIDIGCLSWGGAAVGYGHATS